MDLLFNKAIGGIGEEADEEVDEQSEPVLPKNISRPSQG